MKFLNIHIFLISLSIGLFVNYVTDPNSKVIYVYPTPDNYKEIQYKDKSDKCFNFDPMEVACPTDENEIESYTTHGSVVGKSKII